MSAPVLLRRARWTLPPRLVAPLRRCAVAARTRAGTLLEPPLRLWRAVHRLRLSRWVMGAVLAGALVYVAMSVTLDVTGLGQPSARTAVADFMRAMHPWTTDGGYVVAEEVRPALADLDYGALTPAAFRADVKAWQAELTAIRHRMDQVPVPARLRAAATLFDRAMRQYVAALAAFSRASEAPADQLQGAITAAVPVADAADHTWDRADALVVAQEKKVGLPTPPPVP